MISLLHWLSAWPRSWNPKILLKFSVKLKTCGMRRMNSSNFQMSLIILQRFNIRWMKWTIHISNQWQDRGHELWRCNKTYCIKWTAQSRRFLTTNTTNTDCMIACRWLPHKPYKIFRTCSPALWLRILQQNNLSLINLFRMTKNNMKTPITNDLNYECLLN